MGFSVDGGRILSDEFLIIFNPTIRTKHSLSTSNGFKGPELKHVDTNIE